jgi:hypothetical protein
MTDDLPPLPNLADLLGDLGDPGPPSTTEPLQYPAPLTVGTLRRWNAERATTPRED